MSGSSPTPEEIETQISAQREQLAETVDRLTRKLDVKAQTRARVAALRPQQVVAAVGLVVAVVGLVWWRRHR